MRLYPNFTSLIPLFINRVCVYQEALIRNWVTWFGGGGGEQFAETEQSCAKWLMSFPI